MWAIVHRWLAILVVIPLLVWSTTGLLFHLKPGWDRAYESLSAERPTASLRPGTMTSLAALEANAAPSISRIELFDSALGPLYRVTTATGDELFDAITAQRRSPLSAEDARTLAMDAIARSPHRSTYGDVAEVSTSDREIRLRFAGGPTVSVGRSNARLAQRGADTDRIDWLYRLHYLQWTGHRMVDRVLAVLGLILIVAVIVPGLVLFVRRRRIRS